MKSRPAAVPVLWSSGPLPDGQWISLWVISMLQPASFATLLAILLKGKFIGGVPAGEYLAFPVHHLQPTQRTYHPFGQEQTGRRWEYPGIPCKQSTMPAGCSAPDIMSRARWEPELSS